MEYDMHRNLNTYVKVLIKLYKRSKALYELDHLQDGFEWIDANNSDQSIFTFIRKGKREEDNLIIVCNFTGVNYPIYKIGVPKAGEYREVLNSDDQEFGGAGLTNKKTILALEDPFHGQACSIEITIPPFGFQIIRPVKKRKERKGNGKEKVRRHAISRRERE
jgi:1,4-alpha-glucan branching enzyme